MQINTYEELQAYVEESRSTTLSMEVALRPKYSQEYHEAVEELEKAKALSTLTGQQFLASNVEDLSARAEALKPQSPAVVLRFSRLGLDKWRSLLMQKDLTPLEQYEKVLPDTYVGMYSVEGDNLISSDPDLVSTVSSKSILDGPMAHQVVAAFMAWQNASGEVSIRPTS